MNGTIFIVDDDAASRELIRPLLEALHFTYREFDSAEQFLDTTHPQARGCVLAEMRLRGIGGIDLMARLAEIRSTLPVILLTACARTPMTVLGMRQGAINVLDKPIEEGRLWESIQEALRIEAEERRNQEIMLQLQKRFGGLTDQEDEVLQMLLAGQTNRQIAGRLQVSTRTVEARRHSIFRKTQTHTVPDLVRLAVAYKQQRPPMPPFDW